MKIKNKSHRTSTKLILLVTVGLFMAVIIFLQVFPRLSVQTLFPYLKDYEKQSKTVNTSSVYVKRGIFDSYVVYSFDDCSGLSCPQISCYRVRLGLPQKIGTDNGVIKDSLKIDYEKCKIINKVDILATNRDVSISSSGKYILRYSDYTLEIVTPTHSIQLDQIKDSQLSKANVIWDETNKKVFISYIKNGGESFVASISLQNGVTHKEIEIPGGFYGISVDQAFPIVMNKNKTRIAIQSDYIQSFTVFDLMLANRTVYKTVWAYTPIFSEQMYALKDFNMFLDYRWQDNSTLEYNFQGSKIKNYLKD